MFRGMATLKEVRPEWQRRIMLLAIAGLAFCLLVGLVVHRELLAAPRAPA